MGGAAGVIHAASSAVTDCQPNDNVEALRVFMDAAGIEARPLWKPMHKQPCYKDAPAYVNGVSEALFKVGMCLPAGPYVKDEDVKYIVDTIKSAIVRYRHLAVLPKSLQRPQLEMKLWPLSLVGW